MTLYTLLETDSLWDEYYRTKKFEHKTLKAKESYVSRVLASLGYKVKVKDLSSKKSAAYEEFADERRDIYIKV